MFWVCTFCVTVALSCYKMRAVFCFKYNSMDFLISSLCLGKKRATLHRNRKVLESSFLKLHKTAFPWVLQHSPIPTHLSISNFTVAALSSWGAWNAHPRTWGARRCFHYKFHPGESFFTTAGLSGSSFLPACQNQQITLVLVLSALWALAFPEQQPLLFGGLQQAAVTPVVWRKFAANVLQKWEFQG